MQAVRDWESHLERWVLAGVMDRDTAGRIRLWESERAPSCGLRWPIRIALALGALLLGAGGLLFVSAHRDELSDGQRMTLVLLLVSVFHVAGGVAAERFEALSIALHTTGTGALGAGIALTKKIFHLSAHRPAGILLWAIRAALSWALLRHWPQGASVAIQIPCWLAGEWWTITPGEWLPIWAGICALNFTYLTARRSASDSALRKALDWMGCIALLPSVCAVVLYVRSTSNWTESWMAWSIVTLAPLAVSGLLRGRQSVWTAVAVLWTIVLAVVQNGPHDHLLVFGWCAIGAVGLAVGVSGTRAWRASIWGSPDPPSPY